MIKYWVLFWEAIGVTKKGVYKEKNTNPK